MSRSRRDWTIIVIVLLAVVLSLIVPFIPSWIRYIGQMSLAAALASVGVMILLRTGLLSFGQGLFYFLGAYSVALLDKQLLVSDGVVAIIVGAVCSGIVAAGLGFFVARYRGIFFSMLTLAISMVVYGAAIKVRLFGGSDGLNVGMISFLGYHPRGVAMQTASFQLSVWTSALFGIGAHIFLRSRLGKVLEAIEDNEVRLEYLGWSVRHSIHIAYVVAAALAGAGGALAGISARHVDPSFAYWTTAGDFIFVVLLSGQASVLSPFAGAISLEVMRTLASAFFPNAWQLALGGTMLAIVLYLPDGLPSIGVLVYRALKRPCLDAAPQDHAARETATP
jgi:branched-chain amino acid transport system permease protein